MAYVPGLTLALAGFWLVLSGHYDPLMLGLGFVSVLASLWLTARLEVIDAEASPYHRSPHLLAYIGWLVVEIAKANVQVIGQVFAPTERLKPGMSRVKSVGRSDMAKTLFANSITLTPGTVTVDVDGDVLLVHALQAANGEPAAFADMDRRAALAADGRKPLPEAPGMTAQKEPADA
jgi:multicomponent Na+:H+ antiporter subunit E